MILIQATRSERQGANKMKRRLSKMKQTRKALSIALILCMLLGTSLATVLTAFAAAPAGKTTLTTDPETGYPKWSNDETVGWRNGNC